VRVLVTGGAGYIGSISVRHLLETGHDVTVLDSLERGHKEAVDGRARLCVGDVGDRELLDEALRGCDAVLHLAGLIEVGESGREPGRYHQANVVAPVRMLDAMVAHGVDAIAFSSTAAVYGEPETIPITEDAPTRPVNVYGMTKLMFEQMLDAYRAAHGLRSVRFRYFNVAGATADGLLGEAHEPETHIIPRVLAAIAAGQEEFEVFGADYPTPDGTCVRDYIHVLDLARAHGLALEHLVAGERGGVFNLGNGEGFTNLEVVRACSAVTGVDVRVRFGSRRKGDPARLVASAGRAREVLGWEPERAELRTMIEDAWRWHQSHPRGFRAG
jgi:UDP-glucose 4-epimerase